jgi:hypothetical protein
VSDEVLVIRKKLNVLQENILDDVSFFFGNGCADLLIDRLALTIYVCE